MTILIYHLDTVDGKPKMVEHGRFDGKEVTGKITISDITEREVLNEFNRGYWRTSKI